MKLRKIGAGLLLSALVITGASAWLTASKTTIKTNNITTGKLEIKFDNQVNSINLLGAFPMTTEYALEHLEPYSFSVVNNGDIAMDYKLFTQHERIYNNSPFTKILIGKENELGEYVWTDFDYQSLQEDYGSKGFTGGTLNSGESHKYKLIVYLGEEESNPIDVSKTEFRLKLKANQHTDETKMTLSKNWDQSGVPKEMIKTINISNEAPKTYSKEWDASELNNGLIKGYLDNDTISLVAQETIFLPSDSSFLFSNYVNATALNGLENVNSSNVVNMRGIFGRLGEYSNTFRMDVSNLNTSAVKDFSNVFDRTGFYATDLSIGDISKWNVSSGTNFDYMFRELFNNVNEVNLDLSNWDVSNVKSMKQTFYGLGRNSSTVNLTLNNWNTINVETLFGVFERVGLNASTVNINVEGWNTSNVIEMVKLFDNTAKNANEINFNFSSWDTSNVRDFSGAFYSFATDAKIVNGEFNIFSPNAKVDDIFIQAAWNSTGGKFKINYTPESKNKVLEALEYCLRDDIFVLGDEIIK